MEVQAETSTIHPVLNYDSEPLTDSSYSVFNDSYVDPGYFTDASATGESSTAATIYCLDDNLNLDWDDNSWKEFDSVLGEFDSAVDNLFQSHPGTEDDEDEDEEKDDGEYSISDLIKEMGWGGNEDDEDDGEYSISDLIKEMGEDTLSWKAPASDRTKMSLWVFWSSHPPQTNHPCIPNSIHEKIKTVLFNFMLHSTGKILAQFWAPKIIDGRRTLTTLDQPFGVYGIDKGFCGYRRHCLDYVIDVDSKIEDNLGLPGRVFRYAWPEVTPDITFYSIQEYPLRSSAVLSGVKRSLALPIFEPSDGSCVGVLEIVDAEENALFVDVLAGVHLALTVAKLESSYMYFNAEMHTQRCPLHSADEIRKILDVVGATHKLPLAQAWVKRKYSKSCGPKSGDSYRAKCAEVASTYSLPSFEHDGLKTWAFRMSCKEHLVRKSQGVVGKVLLDYKPRFCRDVAQLSTTGYPFASCARNSGLSSCFAICLDSIYDMSEVYVLEFFLPPCDAQIPQTLLESILTTIKQHLRNFKVSSGVEGEELSIEVIKLSLYEEVDSFKLNISDISATSSKIWKGVEEKPDSSDVRVTKDPSIMNMKNGESNVSITSSRSTYSGANSSERKHEDTEISFSYEILKQHFGMNLAVAAERLGVSRSTLKRICRKRDITRWPSSKRKKGKHSLPNCSTKNIREFGQGVDQIPEFGARCPLGPTPPPKETKVALMQDEDKRIVARKSDRQGSHVTIKAYYKDDIIKFTLSLSSGMTELVENVAKRLKLEVEVLRLKFEDDDGDMITITCDEDMQEFFDCSRLLGRAIIKVSIREDTNQAS